MSIWVSASYISVYTNHIICKDGFRLLRYGVYLCKTYLLGCSFRFEIKYLIIFSHRAVHLYLLTNVTHPYSGTGRGKVALSLCFWRGVGVGHWPTGGIYTWPRTQIRF